MSIDIEIHYHKCDNCPGFYFLPCGCAIGHTWCSDCEDPQRIINHNKFPEADLRYESNVQVLLASDKLPGVS